MSTLTNNSVVQASASSVRFEGNVLFVLLADGREITLPLDKIEWLSWLRKATPKQRNQWTIEPGGFAIYWEGLDNGIEVCHLVENISETVEESWSKEIESRIAEIESGNALGIPADEVMAKACRKLINKCSPPN